MPRNPIGSRVHEDEHHGMLEDMNSALSELRGAILDDPGLSHHLLPDSLKSERSAKAKAAREHIRRLHEAFKAAKEPGVSAPTEAMTDRKQPDNLPVMTGGPGTSGLQEMNK